MNDEARNDLLLANRGLAGWMANRWAGRIDGFTRDDLEQEAYCVMAAALKKFDPAKARLSTFLECAIGNRFRWLRDTEGPIRLSRGFAHLLRGVHVAMVHGASEEGAVETVSANGLRRGRNCAPYRARVRKLRTFNRLTCVSFEQLTDQVLGLRES